MENDIKEAEGSEDVRKQGDYWRAMVWRNIRIITMIWSIFISLIIVMNAGVSYVVYSKLTQQSIYALEFAVIVSILALGLILFAVWRERWNIKHMR